MPSLHLIDLGRLCSDGWRVDQQLEFYIFASEAEIAALNITISSLFTCFAIAAAIYLGRDSFAAVSVSLAYSVAAHVFFFVARASLMRSEGLNIPITRFLTAYPVLLLSLLPLGIDVSLLTRLITTVVAVTIYLMLVIRLRLIPRNAFRSLAGALGNRS